MPIRKYYQKYQDFKGLSIQRLTKLEILLNHHIYINNKVIY